MSDAQEALPNPNPSGSDLPPEVSVPIDPASLARHYEQDDVDVRALVRFGIAIGIGVVVALVVLWGVMRVWVGHPVRADLQIPSADVVAPIVEGPGLDAAPEENLESMQQRVDQLLNSYGWVDREAGIVHIPIDVAMQEMVEQGVPARDGPPPNFGLAPAFRMDSTGGVQPVGEDSASEDASLK